MTKDASRILLVGWPSADRVQLESSARKGLVIVHYALDAMHVLGSCRVAGSYGYAATTRKVERISIVDRNSVDDSLALGRAEFEAALHRARELSITLTTVGQYAADLSPFSAGELNGLACAGATHVVSALTVGAYDLFAGTDSELGAAAQLDAGAAAAAKGELLGRDGDPKACEKASPDDSAPPQQCGAPLTVELTALLRGRPADRASRWPGELPTRPCPDKMVSVDGGPAMASFCLDRTEVTAGAYLECVRANLCVGGNMHEVSAERGFLVGRPVVCNYGVRGREDHPANCITYQQSVAYCRAVGKRLPTSDEWQWAARGGLRGTMYPWGNVAPVDTQVCWRRGDTCPVGSHPGGATSTSLEDMVGNVWERTSSPGGDGRSHVSCGGGLYAMNANDVVSWRCSANWDDEQFQDVGFRCAT
jgi:hypothetical protein